MKTRNLFGNLLGNLLAVPMLFLCTFGLIGCSSDNEEGRKAIDYKELVMTVASKKIPGVIMQGNNTVSEAYAIKKEQAGQWSIYDEIAGFEYEKGYEYKIKVSETTYLDYAMGDPSWTERNLLEVISKVKKESEGLPLHLVPETYYKNIPLPQYRYKVEAANQSLIEEDLKANPILPKSYHYMLCSGEGGYLKWMGIEDEKNVFGPYIVKNTNKKPEEMPESYKMLPPDGKVVGCREWTFLDESEQATDCPSFDVFLGHSSKTKSVAPGYNTAYFYKDLTRHYQEKFPAAGVNTVVVSYKIRFTN